jgi:L-Lysine epsilon oxidase N-terminal
MSRTKQDERIVCAKIHPSIGIARVGNSMKPDGYYVGPQVNDPAPKPPGSYRDRTGALKREVAEFRIYGYNAEGRVVRELQMDAATEIEWTVEPQGGLVQF